MGGVEVENGEGYPPPYWGKGQDRGLFPLAENVSYFLLKMPYFDAF